MSSAVKMNRSTLTAGKINARWNMGRNTTKLTTQGAWEVKRCFELPAMTHERDAQIVSQQVERLAGVRGARTDNGHHRVTVVYDITCLDYTHVLEALAEVGFPARDTWWTRLKKGWFQYSDVTGRDNANAPAAPCCSDPKGINQRRK